MRVGSLVKYIGSKHFTIDYLGPIGLVIAVGRIREKLKSCRVLFRGGYEENIKWSKLEVISEAR